jgi:hypothetical protein
VVGGTECNDVAPLRVRERQVEVDEINISYQGFGESNELDALEAVYVRPYGKKDLVAMATVIRNWAIESC